MDRAAIWQEAHDRPSIAHKIARLKVSLPSCSVVLVVIERLSFPCVDGGIDMTVRLKSFRISKRLLYFHSKPERKRRREGILRKNERET